MFVDSRAALSFETVNHLLLKVAERPLDFVAHTPATDHEVMGRGSDAAALAREASAAIVKNCAAMIWSRTVQRLHALEPDFPLWPKSVQKFVKETRLPFQSYISIYYHMCGNAFEGGKVQQSLNTIIDMRHDLAHDKPEPTEEYAPERVDRVRHWYKRLVHFVGQEELLWLPVVRPGRRQLSASLESRPS